MGRREVVQLDEALELRQQGQLSKSYIAVCVTPDLATRLAGNLGAVLRALAGHAKHYGTVPLPCRSGTRIEKARWKGVSAMPKIPH